MIELRTPRDRRAILPFFPRRDTLLLSCAAGNEGRAWVNEAGDAALALSRGFVFLGGRPDEALLRAAWAAFPPCFLTFSGPPAWLGAARAMGAVEEMTRQVMDPPPSFDWDKLRAWSDPPLGFVPHGPDKGLYDQCLAAEWSEDLVSLSPDRETFARKGLFTAVTCGGRVVSGCGAYARAEDGVEIEIDTHPDFRRRGLARCCAARFLLLCREKGLRPHWDAMTPVSAALARQLGFLPGPRYAVVCRPAVSGKRD